MKPIFATLVFVCMVLMISSTFIQTTEAGSSFCDSKCGDRCTKAKEKDRCLKYCGICCEKCNCVPSGTYGNKYECACYMGLKNSKGKSKCP